MDSEVLKRMRTFANQSKFKQLVRCCAAAAACAQQALTRLPIVNRA
jgi:hypothetical protein